MSHGDVTAEEPSVFEVAAEYDTKELANYMGRSCPWKSVETSFKTFRQGPANAELKFVLDCTALDWTTAWTPRALRLPPMVQLDGVTLTLDNDMMCSCERKGALAG